MQAFPYNMASLFKLIFLMCLLHTCMILYKRIFHSFMGQYTLVHKMTKPKRQHINHTIKEKLEILKKLECGVKAVDLCKQYDLKASTLSTWKCQKEKIKEMVEVGKVLDTKHNRGSFLPNVERALHIWFGEMRAKPHPPPLNKQILAEKAT